MVNETTFVSDTFFYIKTMLINNVTDPISSKRQNNEKFVMTAYPKELVNYPVITLRITNLDARRAGMQTTAIDARINMEIRVWALDTKTRDTLFQQVINTLKNIQYSSVTGSAVNGLHDLTILNSVEINEDGDNTPKSKLISVQYDYYSDTLQTGGGVLDFLVLA